MQNEKNTKKYYVKNYKKKVDDDEGVKDYWKKLFKKRKIYFITRDDEEGKNSVFVWFLFLY